MPRHIGLGASLVLCAIAVLASPAPASAEYSTALCDEDVGGLTCASWDLAEFVDLRDMAVRLLTDIIDVLCFATFNGVVTNVTNLGLARPLEIAGEFSYSECSEGCSVTEVSVNADLNMLKTGSETATVAGEWESLWECNLLFHCVYSGEGLTGHALGGLATSMFEKTHVTYEQAELAKVSGLLCPSTATLDALFESIFPLYIRS